MTAKIDRHDIAVPVCPTGCGTGHLVHVTARYEPGTEPVLIFGGAHPAPLNLDVSCPLTGGMFQVQAPRADGTLLSAVALADHLSAPESATPAATPAATPTAAWAEQEWLEWIRNTPAVLRQFCLAMVTASAGAVPVYFALLEYLGLGRSRPGWFLVAGIPPVLLLASCVLFADGLRPGAGYVTAATFPAFRERRLAAMRRRTNAGMALFTAAIALTTVLALALLWS